VKCGLQHRENAAQKSIVGSLIVDCEKKFTFFTQHAESMRAQLNITEEIHNPGFYGKLVKMLQISAKLETRGDKIMLTDVQQ
jgi:hypothetical protein